MLKEKTLARSVNQCEAQKDNLKRSSPTKSTIEQSPGKNDSNNTRAVTPSPATLPLAISNRLRRRGCELPTTKNIPKKKRMRDKQFHYQKCHKVGCPVRNHIEEYRHIGYSRVAAYPAELKSDNPKKQVVANRECKIFHRREWLRRMGLDANDRRRNVFICHLHKFEKETHQVKVEWRGKTWHQRFTCGLPANIGPSSTLNSSTDSRGLGTDRLTNKILEESQLIMQKGSQRQSQTNSQTPRKVRAARPTSISEKLKIAESQRDEFAAKAEMAQADAARALFALNQTCEQQMSDKQHLPINPRVKRAADLEKHVNCTPEREFFRPELLQPRTKKSRSSVASHSPIVTLDLCDREVKRRTGFSSMNALLLYIFVACNGDVGTVLRRNSSLTWLEEWFVHFEHKWGKTLPRLWDIDKTFGPNRRYVVDIIDSKYAIERRGREIWPAYLSHEEDKALRKDKWDLKYPSERIIMWDMTNIDAYGFTDADLQRLTFSKYYNGNVLKGGVFTQLSGWIGTADLWPGAVSDSVYNAQEGYLKRQEEFANNDLVNGDVLPFTNIYDKGYRAKMVAWKTGKQRVLQPVWAKSDQRFGRKETLLSASVASDRAGNERAVNVCKKSWFLMRGFTPAMKPQRINDAWTTWSFQANFMFNPVL